MFFGRWWELKNMRKNKRNEKGPPFCGSLCRKKKSNTTWWEDQIIYFTSWGCSNKRYNFGHHRWTRYNETRFKRLPNIGETFQNGKVKQKREKRGRAWEERKKSPGESKWNGNKRKIRRRSYYYTPSRIVSCWNIRNSLDNFRMQTPSFQCFFLFEFETVKKLYTLLNLIYKVHRSVLVFTLTFGPIGLTCVILSSFSNKLCFAKWIFHFLIILEILGSFYKGTPIGCHSESNTFKWPSVLLFLVPDDRIVFLGGLIVKGHLINESFVFTNFDTWRFLACLLYIWQTHLGEVRLTIVSFPSNRHLCKDFTEISNNQVRTFYRKIWFIWRRRVAIKINWSLRFVISFLCTGLGIKSPHSSSRRSQEIWWFWI